MQLEIIANWQSSLWYLLVVSNQIDLRTQILIRRTANLRINMYFVIIIYNNNETKKLSESTCRTYFVRRKPKNLNQKFTITNHNGVQEALNLQIIARWIPLSEKLAKINQQNTKIIYSTREHLLWKKPWDPNLSHIYGKENSLNTKYYPQGQSITTSADLSIGPRTEKYKLHLLNDTAQWEYFLLAEYTCNSQTVSMVDSATQKNRNVSYIKKEEFDRKRDK